MRRQRCWGIASFSSSGKRHLCETCCYATVKTGTQICSALWSALMISPFLCDVRTFGPYPIWLMTPIRFR
jgi:hypothetical protein